MNRSAVEVNSEHEQILGMLVDYILSHYPSKFTKETLPRDESLLDLEVLDSAGVIEFIVFSETTWGIEISDDDYHQGTHGLPQQNGKPGAAVCR